MAKTERQFRYTGDNRSIEDTTRAAQQGLSAFDSYIDKSCTVFTAKEGENNVRIMPNTWEDEDKWGSYWYLKIFVHYEVGGNHGQFLCLEKMKNEPCPVCAAWRATEDEKERKAWGPKPRVLCYLIDRRNERAGPQVWSMPNQAYQDINAASVDKQNNRDLKIDAPGPPDSKIEGYDISFIREGTKKEGTEYKRAEASRKSLPLHDDPAVQKRWMDYIVNKPLTEVMCFYPADYIEKILYGGSRKEDVVEEEVQDRGSERRSRGRPAPETEAEGDGGREAEKRTSERPRRFDRDERAIDPDARRARDEEGDREDTGENPDGERSTRRSRREPEVETASGDEDLRSTRRSRRLADDEKPPFDEDSNGVGERRRLPKDTDVDDVPAQSRDAREGLNKLRERTSRR